MSKANVKFKLIFLNKKKQDGTPYTKMMTIIKDGEKDVWIEVKFGEDVNEKQFKGENQIITANIDDIRMPLSLKPYEKDGKKKYPYVWVEKIVACEKAPFIKAEPKQAVQSMFKIDDDLSGSVVSGNQINNEETPSFE